MAYRYHRCIPIWILAFAVSAAWASVDLDVVDGHGRHIGIESVLRNISAARAVFIGENHDRYDQHLSELEIIRGLYEQDPGRWAIGVEFIQRPFQRDLDAYIAGKISEREFLRKTEYFDRWGYDFRLYRPIFRFAREHAIPVVALNADRDLTRRIGELGLEGLNDAERERLPAQIDKSDRRYRKRIQKVFNQHGHTKSADFEHFWEVQLVWDETMAETVAEYLSSHPQKAMVVLAGAGHMESGSGIPNRVRRRLPQLRTVVLITGDQPQADAHLADYWLISKKEVLAPPPAIGIITEVGDGVRVKEVTPDGPAEASGIKPQDRIVAIDDEQINSMDDVRLALFDKEAGDPITLYVQRDGPAGAENLMFAVRLQ